MAFPVIGGTQESGYNIDNSLRFNYVDSADLRFTPSSAGTEETFTISAWIKKTMNSANSGIGGQDCYLFSSQTDSNNRTVMGVFGSSGTQGIFFENKVSGTSSYVDSAATFRDPSAWMHCVWAIDTTQSTDTNRVKLYVNGSQISSFDSTSYPAQNTVTQWSRAQINYIGSRAGGNYYDGYLSEVHVIDGQQLAPTEFGETDDNGVWIPKNYTGSYGTTGFKLEFKQLGTAADATSIGADTSGNDNHFSQTNVTPAVDRTTDTPTNNFCTLNAVDNDGFVTSEGNCNFDSSSGSDEGIRGTMGLQNGKWYYECKITNSAGLSAGNIGYANPVMQLTENPRGGECVVMNGSITANVYNNSASGVQIDAGAGIVQNDIVGVALDLDSGTKTIAFYRNGSIIGSAQTIASALLDDFLLPCMFDDGGVNDVVGSFNFGNPSFTISSGNSDANGYGNFEYAVPSGYYALCTKNLAQYG